MVDVVPFDGDHVDAAADLLSERHRRHREVVELLPQRFETPATARAEIEALIAIDGWSGAVALVDRHVAAFVLARPRGDRAMWVEVAGHAADDPELARDLYASLAEQWLAEGRREHNVVVPARAELLDPWYQLQFAQQLAYAVRDVPPGVAEPPSRFVVRPGRAEDVDNAMPLVRLLGEYQAGAAVFHDGELESDASLRDEWLAETASAGQGPIVAMAGERLVGVVFVGPVALSSTHVGLARPDDCCILGYAATLPDVRGSGAGLALTEASFAWAREHGYRAMVVDWRTANLLSSRFWPRRGFRTTFLRLHRTV